MTQLEKALVNIRDELIKDGSITYLIEHRLVSTLLATISEDCYKLIPFPDYKDYMEKEWFKEEAIKNIKGYLIPLKRIIR